MEIIGTSLHTGVWVTTIEFKDAYYHIPIQASPGNTCVFTSSFNPTNSSTTIWSVHSTHGIHGSGKGGQTDVFTQGYKNPPVPRWLVGQSHIPPNLSPSYTNSSNSVFGNRFNGEFGKKSELDPKQVFNIVGFQFDLKEGKVRPTSEHWQTQLQRYRSCSDVPDRVVNSYRKAQAHCNTRGLTHSRLTECSSKLTQASWAHPDMVSPFRGL